MAVKTLADAAPDEVRFAELKRRMPGVSQKMLSVTLRSLTRDGLVSRRVEPTVPPRVFYRLTPLGQSLEVALAGLRTWAEDHMAEIDDANEAADQGGDEGQMAAGFRAQRGSLPDGVPQLPHAAVDMSRGPGKPDTVQAS